MVDGDHTLCPLVSMALRSDASVHWVETIEEAKEVLLSRRDFDMVVTDRVLPDGDGIALCQWIRSEVGDANLSVVFLTTLEDEADTVAGYFAGADDYIPKPLSPLLFRARILARFRQQVVSPVKLGRLEVDQAAQRVFLEEGGRKREINLTRTEFKILKTLSDSIDRVYSREELLFRVWGDSCHVTDRVIDTHISHLRRKIVSSLIRIECLRGEGYRLSIHVENLEQAA